MAYSNKTINLMKEYSNRGYEIIEGNNPILDKAKKYQGKDVVRLCLTNSRYHGYSVHTVWAVK